MWQWFQQLFGAAIPVSSRLAATTGQVMIRLADLCPNWPYTWPGQTKWLAQVKAVIEDKIASGRTNYYGYEIWNERHGTWAESNGDFYTLCWKPTYDLIRSLDPDAKIIGPSDSYYRSDRLKEFLTYCKNNDCCLILSAGMNC
uniref:CAZy families GH39 protein n=1 Tax=uncultured Teredinibacter sp. TaxID=1434395 RepID=A0A060BY02_9GAMM|nr:CAZy families GH39 protein [uncultured Teredinibacter sp.]